jgi:predicted amidohydrolase
MTLIAVQQLAPVLGDLDHNRAMALAAIREAIDAGAEVVVLPELITSGYVFSSPDEAADVAIGADHELLREWAQEARRGGVVVVGGFCERGEDGRLYNSAALIDSSGLRAVYPQAAPVGPRGADLRTRVRSAAGPEHPRRSCR